MPDKSYKNVVMSPDRSVRGGGGGGGGHGLGTGLHYYKVHCFHTEPLALAGHKQWSCRTGHPPDQLGGHGLGTGL